MNAPQRPTDARPIVAVDIGNSGAKLGRFISTAAEPLPIPERTHWVDPLSGNLESISAWLAPHAIDDVRWFIASVNRPSASRLLAWLRNECANVAPWLVASLDLPLIVRLERPDMVGIDRLVDAVAANRLRTQGVPAVVADLGSAITVDLISGEGAFLGGSILAGTGITARALHEFTDMLPLLDVREVSAAPPLGTQTVEAMKSGLFWGAVGAVRELIEQLPQALPAAERRSGVEVFITGGGGADVARALGGKARYVPHLTLSGIALTATAEIHHGGTERGEEE